MKLGNLMSAAMEEISEDLITDPVVETPVEETPEQAAESTAQVEDTFGDVESAMEAIDEAVADVETLDSVADNLGKIEATGGMDENMAAIAQVAIESLYKKLGVKRLSLPAMETYSSTKTRKSATALALENIQETAKKVWQAILNMLKQAYEFVKKFFKAVFDKNTKIANAAKAKLETLKKFRADNNMDDSIVDGKIDNENLATALNIEGKTDFSTIKSGFESLDVFLKAAKETTEGLKTHMGLMHGFLGKMTEKDLDDNFAMPGLDKLGWKESKEGNYSFGGLNTLGFGNFNLIVRGFDTGEKYSSSFHVTLDTHNTKEPSKELNVLSLDEIQKSLELIIAQSVEIEKSKSVISELEEIQKSLEEESNMIIGILTKVEASNLSVAKRAITVISKLSIKINTVVSKYAISSSGHVLHYVDLCMKEHKIVTETPVSA